MKQAGRKQQWKMMKLSSGNAAAAPGITRVENKLQIGVGEEAW